MNNVFTFWEGPMPAYIKLCMQTWKHPYILLNYENLHEYTDVPVERLKRFTLPQIADIVRVHVLRDQGGYWLDADTVMVTGKLPVTDLVGHPDNRTCSIGLLYSEPHADMFTEWARYQDEVIDSADREYRWDLMGNAFINPYAKEHEEIRICPIDDYYPEVYMIRDDIPRRKKYKRFYFKTSYHLSDIRPTDILMLHNSWTPDWYSKMSEDEVLNYDCTLSNILKEV